MGKFRAAILMVSVPIGMSAAVLAQAPIGPAVPVTVDNYNRAQSDVYFAGAVKNGAFGKFLPVRTLAPVEQRGIIRPNRDTLYSFAVFDLDAGPVTITLPQAANRFAALQFINEDQYTQGVYYGGGTHALTRTMAGTRYALGVFRVLVDFRDDKDIQQAHALQDEIKVSQAATGTFVVPNWDDASRRKVQAALLELGTTVTDTRRMFGANESQVDPVKHLIGSAMLWGGNPERDALYLPITPPRNDGSVVYKLTVRDVPVAGFWSVSVYNSEGYFQPNRYDAYSVSSVTAQKDPDGAVTIQFGGCDGVIRNCLPTVKGWNYTVRLFRPGAEVLKGRWVFPVARPLIPLPRRVQ